MSAQQDEGDCEYEGSFVVVQSPKKRYHNSILRLLGASLCILFAIAAWVTMAEKLQKLTEQYQKPYFLSYWIHSFYAMFYVFWRFWRSFPGNTRAEAFPKSGKLVVFAGVIQLIAFISGYTWYYSLSRTNIPANTAIYQCACAIVFVFSVPLLKERVTALKVLCVIFSIVGVCLVAIYSSQKDCGVTGSSLNTTNKTNTTHNYQSHDLNYQSHDLSYQSHDLNYQSHDLSYQSHDHNHPPVLTHISKGGNACAENSTSLGYILLACSVLCYGLFEVLYKKFATKKGDPAAAQNGMRFLGYMGIHTLLWMWPPILIVDAIGLEKFEWPTLEILGYIFLNTALDGIFNICVLISIALSSPLFTSVGTILAIPTAVIVDWIIQGYVLPVLAFVGIFLIVLGFAGFVVSEVVTAKQESKVKNLPTTGQQLQIQAAAASEKKGEDSPLIVKDEEKRSLSQLIIKYLI